MVNQKLRFLVLWSILLISGACQLGIKQENSNSDFQTINIDQVVIKEEIRIWKQELLESKQIGSPFNYQNLDSLVHQKWRVNNPNQMDGLPSDDKKIKSIRYDFNNDNKEDLLLYFQGDNCTGHNGGTETYAKIIYSDGTSKSDLMTEIIITIQSEYNQMRKTNKKLKEITNGYLETTTTINGYHNGITGKFNLYTEYDAHCCPSYNGSYTYNLKEEKMKIEIFENTNQ